jgi:hypothetical protein
MDDLKALLHRLAEAIHRPADHPLAELSAAVDALEGAPEPAAPVAPDPAPQAEPSDPDTPAPVFQPAPAPFGSETAPEGASFPVQHDPS